MNTNPEKEVAENEEEDDDKGDYNPEEEIFKQQGAPTLPPRLVNTGEENDEEITKFRAKIYRWHDKQWKERGAGDLKFLRNKATSKIRLIMRQDKTGKVIANHFIETSHGLCQLSQLKTSDKAWLWTCYDASDEEPKIEKLCVKFTTAEEIERFKAEFQKSYDSNKALSTQPEEPQQQQQPPAEKAE